MGSTASSAPLSPRSFTPATTIMKVVILLAAIAVASASVVVPSAPIAHISGVPTISGLHNTFPTLYSGAWSGYPTTFLTGSPTVYTSGAFVPKVYSGVSNVSPLVYSGATNVISNAVVPKYYSENKGARHIVNY